MGKRVVFPQKNIGCTPTERILARLCEKTFLKLWSYTSLYNDEGLNRNKKGKEICDLLVYFNNTVVIFSDKEITYSEGKGTEIAWSRWKRKAIDNSIKQMEGAEHWIKAHYDRIYFNEECRDKFPFINESNITKLKIYRVAIANGCPRGLSLGSKERAFIVNDPQDKNGNYVHVFDNRTIEVLANELSTVKEFVRYLEKKECLAKTVFFAHYEEINELDLLATYLLSPSESRDNDFYHKDIGFKIESYNDLINSSDYQNGKKEDQISVIFDLMIESISTQFMRGENIGTGYETFEVNQKVIEVLSEFERLGRRDLSKSIIDKFKETCGRQISSRAIGEDSDKPRNASFVVVIFPKAVCKGMNRQEYQKERLAIAQAYAYHYLLTFKRDVVVIVFDNINELPTLWKNHYQNFMEKVCQKGLSLVYQDEESITENNYDLFITMQKKYGILSSSRIRSFCDRSYQYPNPK